MKKIIAVAVLSLAGFSAHASDKIMNCSSKFYNPNVKCYSEAPKETVEEMQAEAREAFRPDAQAQAYRDSDTRELEKESRVLEHCKAATEIAVERFYINYGKMPTENQIMVTLSNCFNRLSNK